MELKKGMFEKIINILCLSLLIGMVVFLVMVWADIPERIPMHYNIYGEPDRWGDKIWIIALPTMSWGFYFTLTFIEYFPSWWKTGVKITEENKERVYPILLPMATSMKLILGCLLSYITYNTALTFELSSWYLVLFIVVLFGNLGYWNWRLHKVK